MKKVAKMFAFALAMVLTIVSVRSMTAKAMTEDEILAAIKTLEPGQSLDGTQSLTGVITEIKTAYSEQYGNITVNFKVQDTVIQAFRMKGGAELKVGDKIKVTGTITNYNGTIEFAKDCTYEIVQAGGADPTPVPKTLTEAEILEAIKTLEPGQSIPGTQSLTGTITEIQTAYSEQYNNVTVALDVKGVTIVAFRMAGGSELKVGDQITVYGTIKNYNGTIEFDSKCTYTKPGENPPTGVESELPVAGMIAVVALGAVAASVLADKKRKNVQ